MQKDLLLRCVLESLSLFGDNTKTALLAQYQKEGLQLNPEQFDIRKFCMVTEKFLGRSADFIFVKIIDEFCTQSKISLEEFNLAKRARFLTDSGILMSLFEKVKERS